MSRPVQPEPPDDQLTPAAFAAALAEGKRQGRRWSWITFGPVILASLVWSWYANELRWPVHAGCAALILAWIWYRWRTQRAR